MPNRRLLLAFTLLFAFVALPGAALALPTLSIDADPSEPGIQSNLAVELGERFTVDVVIQDVVLPDSISAFGFAVVFDSSVLTAVDVVSGDYLNPPVFEVLSEAGDFLAIQAEVSWGAGATGDGVLASITFDAIDEGVSGVDFARILLIEPDSSFLRVAAADGALIGVGGGASPGTTSGGGSGPAVPEPSAAILFAAGMLVVRSGVRR